MRIFLDTANIEQIREAAKLGIIDGVTTNPSLVSKEGKADYQAAIKEICSIITGPISAEVLAEEVESMIEQEPSSWPRIMAIVRHASLGIMAICALFVLRIFRGAKKKAATTAPTGQLAGAEGPVGLLPAEAGRSEPLVLRKQIASALQSNPGQVKQLFSSWLEEKGG